MKLLTILALALCVSCREWEAPQFDVTHTPPNVTIGDLRAYYGGAEGNGDELTIADEIIISGRVVSSDKDGNFYNTFFIDDGTGAVEIMAGIPNLDALHPPGRRVAVRARGLAVGWRDGAMQIGLPPEPGNRFPTGYFYHPAVMGRYVSGELSVEQVEPVEVSFVELHPSMSGRPVRIEGLTLDPLETASTWASRDPVPTTGYVEFRTREGDPLTVITSGYASWALAMVPNPGEEVSLTGILLYGRGGGSRDHYLIKLRYETDIDF
ncbi:MAG: DUF5689 domain-containing protein [Alistipes sp.]|jgi:hypothetical protein|nr:DUF5689 domain-containing protein [Alistipes sp.]